MRQYPSFGSSHIDQPRHTEDMTNKEQEARRIRILESDKFAELLEERIEDRPVLGESVTFSRAEIGIIGYYLGMGDKIGLYRYIKELIGADVESIVRNMEE